MKQVMCTLTISHLTKTRGTEFILFSIALSLTSTWTGLRGNVFSQKIEEPEDKRENEGQGQRCVCPPPPRTAAPPPPAPVYSEERWTQAGSALSSLQKRSWLCAGTVLHCHRIKARRSGNTQVFSQWFLEESGVLEGNSFPFRCNQEVWNQKLTARQPAVRKFRDPEAGLPHPRVKSTL